MRYSVLNTPDDIAWARDVHDKGIPTDIQFAVLYGNEDCPVRIDCWRDPNPEFAHKPDYQFVRAEDGAVESFFCTSKRDGGPAKRRFYKSEQAARDAMTRAIRNGAEWAGYGRGRHHGAGEFSVKTVMGQKGKAQ